MGTFHAIFFWIGLTATVSTATVVAACLLATMHRPRRRSCMVMGCHGLAMPRWKVCLRCHNARSEPSLSEELEFPRRAG